MLNRILTLISCLLLLTQCQRKPKNIEQPSDVVAFVLGQPSEVYDPAIFAGFLRSKSQRQIASEVRGHLTRILVNPGERVEVGQVLATIAPLGAGFDFQHHQVRSPINGVIISAADQMLSGKSVDAGDELFVVGDPSQVELEFQAAIEDVELVNVGSALNLLDDQDSWNKGLAAKVTARARAVDPRFGTVAVKVDVFCSQDAKANGSCQLPMVGSYVRLLSRKNIRVGYLVPQSALQFGEKSIFIIDPKNGKVAERKIDMVETLEDGFVLLTAGVKAGDQIVSAATRVIKSGDKIKVARTDQSEALDEKLRYSQFRKSTQKS